MSWTNARHPINTSADSGRYKCSCCGAMSGQHTMSANFDQHHPEFHKCPRPCRPLTTVVGTMVDRGNGYGED